MCRGSKNFAFGLMAGKFWRFGLKALFVSCAFILRVAEAPADHEFRGCSRDDKPVFIQYSDLFSFLIYSLSKRELKGKTKFAIISVKTVKLAMENVHSLFYRGS